MRDASTQTGVDAGPLLPSSPCTFALHLRACNGVRSVEVTDVGAQPCALVVSSTGFTALVHPRTCEPDCVDISCPKNNKQIAFLVPCVCVELCADTGMGATRVVVTFRRHCHACTVLRLVDDGGAAVAHSSGSVLV